MRHPLILILLHSRAAYLLLLPHENLISACSAAVLFVSFRHLSHFSSDLHVGASFIVHSSIARSVHAFYNPYSILPPGSVFSCSGSCSPPMSRLSKPYSHNAYYLCKTSCRRKHETWINRPVNVRPSSIRTLPLLGSFILTSYHFPCQTTTPNQRS